MEKILEVINLSKIYQSKENEILAINDVNFSINKGEFVSIIGPSGCGKSTLLSAIAGLIPKTKGKILIDNEEVFGITDKMGYMLQKDCLLEWRTILKNILFESIIHLLFKYIKHYSIISCYNESIVGGCLWKKICRL